MLVVKHAEILVDGRAAGFADGEVVVVDDVSIVVHDNEYGHRRNQRDQSSNAWNRQKQL